MPVAPSLGACIALLAALSGAAAEPMLTLELNKLEPRGPDCRAYFRIQNLAPDPYRSLKADLFILDPHGVVSRRLALELAPIPARKTLIKTFDVQGLACDRFGSLLLSDLLACEGPGGPPQDCLAAIDTASKSSVPFTK